MAFTLQTGEIKFKNNNSAQYQNSLNIFTDLETIRNTNQYLTQLEDKQGQVINNINSYISLANYYANEASNSADRAMSEAAAAASGVRTDTAEQGLTKIQKSNARTNIDAVSQAELGNLRTEINNIHALPSGGSSAQILAKKSNSDYDVEWSPVGTPSDTQVDSAVSDWLDNHPEATITVQDGAVTWDKLNDGVKNKVTYNHKATTILENSHSATDLQGATHLEIYPNENFANVPVRICNRANLFPNFVNIEQKSEEGYRGVRAVIANNTLFLDLTDKESTETPLAIDVIDDRNPAVFGSANKMLLPEGIVPGSTYRLFFVSSTISNNISFYLYFFDSTGTRIDSYSMSCSNNYVMDKSVTVDANAVYYRIYGSIQGTATLTKYAFQFYLFPIDRTVTTQNIVSETLTIDNEYENGVTIFPNYSIGYYSEAITNVPDQISIINREAMTYVTPEMFGAKADAYTDDGDAINACIAYANRTKKTVQAHGIYYTSKTINILYSRLRVYIHHIVYGGNDLAVLLNGTENHIEIDHIFSNGVGFRVLALPTQVATENNISIDEIKAVGNAFECVPGASSPCMASYSEYKFRKLQSYTGHGLYLLRTYGEKSIYGGTILAPNGWSIWTEDGNSGFYGFALESFRGIYCASGNNQFMSFRTAELMDKKRFHSEDYTDPDIGLLFKFAGERGTTGNLWVSRSLIYKECLDISEVVPIKDHSTGDANAELFACSTPTILYTRNASNRQAMYSGQEGKILIYPERIVFSSEGHDTVTKINQSLFTSTGVCDLRIGTNTTCYAREFIIQDNCDIILDASWCSVGHNELIIDQETYGAYCRVYDSSEILLFDGYKAKEGKYKLHAQALYVGEYGSAYYQGINFYYYGENDRWLVERIDDKYRTIKEVTLEEATPIDINTDSDGDSLDLSEMFVTITIPANLTYSSFEPVIYVEKIDGTRVSIGYNTIEADSTGTTSIRWATLHAFKEHGYWRIEATAKGANQSALSKTNNGTRLVYSEEEYPKIVRIACTANAPAGTKVEIMGIRRIAKTEIIRLKELDEINAAQETGN